MVRQAVTAASRSASGTTRLTSPRRSASSARTRRPESTRSSTTLRLPTARRIGRRDDHGQQAEPDLGQPETALSAARGRSRPPRPGHSPRPARSPAPCDHRLGPLGAWPDHPRHPVEMTAALLDRRVALELREIGPGAEGRSPAPRSTTTRTAAIAGGPPRPPPARPGWCGPGRCGVLAVDRDGEDGPRVRTRAWATQRPPAANARSTAASRSGSGLPGAPTRGLRLARRARSCRDAARRSSAAPRTRSPDRWRRVAGAADLQDHAPVALVGEGEDRALRGARPPSRDRRRAHGTTRSRRRQGRVGACGPPVGKPPAWP